MPTSEKILAKPLVFMIMSAFETNSTTEVWRKCLRLALWRWLFIRNAVNELLLSCWQQTIVCQVLCPHRCDHFSLQTRPSLIKKTTPGLLNWPNFLSTSPRIPITFFAPRQHSVSNWNFSEYVTVNSFDFPRFLLYVLYSFFRVFKHNNINHEYLSANANEANSFFFCGMCLLFLRDFT